VAENPKTIYDTLSSFQDGINSGVQPLLLPKTQCSFAINATFRGGYIQDRPPFQKQSLDYNGNAALQAIVETGFFQGSGIYRPDFGTSLILAQIAGHLILFTPTGLVGWRVSDVSVAGDLNDTSTGQVWMWQAEKWMIINDGTTKLPIFFDGVSSRRSLGDSKTLGSVIAAAPGSPPALGGIVSATLSAPYTGLYNIPVIFNSAYYQISSQAAAGYPVSLKNVTKVFAGTGYAGTVIAAGSSVAVIPSQVSTIPIAGNAPINGVTNILVTTTDQLFVGMVLVGVRVNNCLGPLAVNFIITSIDKTTNIIGIVAETLQATCGSAPQTFIVQTLFTSTSQPNVTIGITTADFTIPLNGSSVTVGLTSPYTGDQNKTVWINGMLFLISNITSASTTSIRLINISDTSAVAYALPKPMLSIPELPAGRMGAYGMGRNWMSLTDGISYMAGDIVGGASGSPANNYRDSVLRTTENTFLTGGGSFRLPGSGNTISSMTFTANLDTSLGQGALQIGTDTGFFSNNSPVDRAEWVALQNPIQTESLIGQGSLAQNSTILSNSDTIFRSAEGIGSLKIARRDFNNDLGGNAPISREVERALKNDNITLLPRCSATTFDNRLLMTCYPAVSSQGVFHQGLVALNYDLISSLRGKSPAVYDGLWTGLNILQLMSGNFAGTGKAYAFGYNITYSRIELYEILRSTGGKHFDNHDTRIKWMFETPVLFGQDVKKISELIRLQDGEISIQDIIGKVDFKIEYKPDYYPCWVTWREFQVCSDMTSFHAKPGYITRIGFGEPAGDACEDGNNRPFRNAHFFQLRITITGHCKVMGIRLAASPEPIVDFAEPICAELCEPDLPLPDL